MSGLHFDYFQDNQWAMNINFQDGNQVAAVLWVFILDSLFLTLVKAINFHLSACQQIKKLAFHCFLLELV